MILRASLYILIVLSCIQCYSFKSTSIAPDIDAFLVQNFNVQALAAPPNINVTFSNRLQDQIERETRLKYRETDPDIIFSGSITSFNVTPQGAQADGTTSFDRLTVGIRVSYEDSSDPDKNWEKVFTDFEDYDASVNLLSVQDELLDLIFTRLADNVINEAFSSW